LLDHPFIQIAVGVPGIALAVAPFPDLVETGDEGDLGQLTSLLQVIEELVSLGVNVRRPASLQSYRHATTFRVRPRL
jgi:hypothetical protein